MNETAVTHETNAQRIWRRFSSDSYAYVSLWIVIVLFVIGGLAPFIANSHAIVRYADGQLTFPAFRSLEPIEWRFLLYVPLAWFIYLGRKHLLRAPQMDLGLLVLYVALIYAAAKALPGHFVLRGHLLGAYYYFAHHIRPWAWCLILGVPFAAFVFVNRVLFSRRPRFDFTVILLVIVAMEVALSFWHPFNDPTNDRDRPADFKIMPLIHYSPIESSEDQFSPPSMKHLCGTDSTGRDIAARMLHGARTSLSIGFVAAGIALSIGITLGGLAGYYRSWIDMGICRVIEIMDCFPTLLLILVAISFFGSQNNMFYIMAVIGFTSWTGVARLVRGEFLRLTSQPFPQAAKALGAGDFRIITKHLLPNSIGPVLVAGTFGVASAILLESSLSFLGFGMQAPTPSWGDILSDARIYIDFAWWLAFFPGCAILITIMAYNFVGEGLRDAVDPRMRVK